MNSLSLDPSEYIVCTNETIFEGVASLRFACLWFVATFCCNNDQFTICEENALCNVKHDYFVYLFRLQKQQNKQFQRISNYIPTSKICFSNFTYKIKNNAA